MKKILLGLFLFLAAVVPAGTQQLAFTAVTATTSTVSVYSNMPIDTTNYPWAQSFVFTFTAGNSNDRFVVETSNDPTFTSINGNAVIHFFSGIAGHADTAANSVPVVGETWCTSTGTGRYIRLRASIQVSGTPNTAIVTLQPGVCPLASQQGQASTTAAGGGFWPISVNPYPPSATVTTMANTGSTGAVTIALGAQSGKTTYLCGFDVSAIGGTAAIGPITIGQVSSGQGSNGFTLTYQSSSSAAGIIISKTFTPCLPAPATNTQIVGTTTADGTATAVDFSAYGYIQ